jgi:predicted secreted protein
LLEKIMRIRLILKFVFFLPGTFLHELAHYAAALILGKAEGFSVLPKTEGDSIVFGSVKSRTRYKVLSSFIAIAPLLWWAVLFLVLRHLRVIETGNGMPEINFGLTAAKLKRFSLSEAFLLWLFAQILWAGRPSVRDIKNFFTGLLSVSGFLLISATAGLICLLRHFAPGR